MKKQLTVLVMSAAALFAQGRGPGGPGGFGGPGGGFGRGMEMGGRVVTGAPYSGVETLTTQAKFADGNSVNTSHSTQRARDGQGRTYSSESITPAASAGKAPYTRTTIMDPVAGYRYELDSSTMIAYESRIPKAPPAHTASAPAAPTASTRTLPNGATETVTVLGTQTVNGVQATGTQITEVIPAGAIGNAQPITKTRVTWISNDLKLPVQIKSSDPRVGSTDMELTNISTGEPAASLFTVPSTYTTQKGGPGMGRGPRGPGGASGRPAGRMGGPGPFGRRGGPPPQ
jgi:hypothetical protein